MALPQPITGAEEYLKAVHERLGQTNELLRTLLDRTPAPAAQSDEGGVVELREPAKAADEPGAPDERPASLREPSQKKPARRQTQRARTTATTKEGA